MICSKAVCFRKKMYFCNANHNKEETRESETDSQTISRTKYFRTWYKHPVQAIARAMTTLLQGAFSN